MIDPAVRGVPRGPARERVETSSVSFGVLIQKLRLFNRPFSAYLHPYCTTTLVTIEIAVPRVSRVDVAGRVTGISRVTIRGREGTDVYAMLMQ